MKIIGSLLMGVALLSAVFLGSADAIGTQAWQTSYQADWYAINQETATVPGVEMAEQELGRKTWQTSYQADWYAINQETATAGVEMAEQELGRKTWQRSYQADWYAINQETATAGFEMAGTGGGAQNLKECDESGYASYRIAGSARILCYYYER